MQKRRRLLQAPGGQIWKGPSSQEATSSSPLEFTRDAQHLPGGRQRSRLKMQREREREKHTRLRSAASNFCRAQRHAIERCPEGRDTCSTPSERTDAARTAAQPTGAHPTTSSPHNPAVAAVGPRASLVVSALLIVLVVRHLAVGGEHEPQVLALASGARPPFLRPVLEGAERHDEEQGCQGVGHPLPLRAPLQTPSLQRQGTNPGRVGDPGSASAPEQSGRDHLDPGEKVQAPICAHQLECLLRHLLLHLELKVDHTDKYIEQVHSEDCDCGEGDHELEQRLTLFEAQVACEQGREGLQQVDLNRRLPLIAHHLKRVHERDEPDGGQRQGREQASAQPYNRQYRPRCMLRERERAEELQPIDEDNAHLHHRARAVREP
mmetsp:Transcript_99472/g.287117  ORF Transcript_99472/g.287117 Transcript_99472/m.287117 type:complete len:379 (+) Transcript_99472:3-1139(+)